MRNACVFFAQGDGTGDAYSSSYTQGNLTGFNTAFDSGSNSLVRTFMYHFWYIHLTPPFQAVPLQQNILKCFPLRHLLLMIQLVTVCLKLTFSQITVEWDDSDDSIAIAENASAVLLVVRLLPIRVQIISMYQFLQIMVL